MKRLCLFDKASSCSKPKRVPTQIAYHLGRELIKQSIMGVMHSRNSIVVPFLAIGLFTVETVNDFTYIFNCSFHEMHKLIIVGGRQSN